MTKDAVIILRVEGETKKRIAGAARSVGKSVTNFLVEGIMQQVERIERNAQQPVRVIRGACPTFFVALCTTAQAGGGSSYVDAGYELARHIPELGSHDVDDEVWVQAVEDLVELLRQSDDDKVVAWLKRHLP